MCVYDYLIDLCVIYYRMFELDVIVMYIERNIRDCLDYFFKTFKRALTPSRPRPSSG